MSAQQQHDDSRLADRYGTNKTVVGRVSKLSKKQRTWLMIAGLGLLTIVAVWFTFAGFLKPYTHKEVGYKIVSPTEAHVEFQISKRPADTLSCNIQVLNEVYAVVGSKTITIGPDTAKDTEESANSVVEGATEVGQATSTDRYYRTTLRTDSLGVTGVVDGCWVVQAEN